jgi:hypothetical protein
MGSLTGRGSSAVREGHRNCIVALLHDRHLSLGRWEIPGLPSHLVLRGHLSHFLEHLEFSRYSNCDTVICKVLCAPLMYSPAPSQCPVTVVPRFAQNFLVSVLLSLLTFLWKNMKRLMRSPHCLSIYIFTRLSFHLFVYQCVSPLPLYPKEAYEITQLFVHLCILPQFC